MLDGEKTIVADPDLRDLLLRTPAVSFWIGPRAHAVGYAVRGGRMYNLVLLCPDDLPEDVARQRGSLDEMRGLFRGWDPTLMRLLEQVKEVDKWKLMHRPELATWTSSKGTFALVGDASHPMLPYLAQGANSALEDGAAMGAVLKGVRGKGEVGERVKLWEGLRKGRSESIARETFAQVGWVCVCWGVGSLC